MESLLKNDKVFLDETSLSSIFNKFIQMPELNLGYIRTQNAWSNFKSDYMFHFEVSSKISNKIKKFSREFGFTKVGKYVFFAHPNCPCNNPETIWVRKPNKLWKEEEETFLAIFEKKEFNIKFNVDFEWVRIEPYHHLKTIDWLRRDFLNHNVYVDSKENIYTPFQMCDGILHFKMNPPGSILSFSTGCTSPSFYGYIKRSPTKTSPVSPQPS